MDGAERLSDEGMGQLVEAGEATAQEFGQMYATIEAGAERAQTEDMVYGAPEDAVGLAAYSYEIKGEFGDGSRNLVRTSEGWRSSPRVRPPSRSAVGSSDSHIGTRAGGRRDSGVPQPRVGTLDVPHGLL